MQGTNRIPVKHKYQTKREIGSGRKEQRNCGEIDHQIKRLNLKIKCEIGADFGTEGSNTVRNSQRRWWYREDQKYGGGSMWEVMESAENLGFDGCWKEKATDWKIYGRCKIGLIYMFLFFSKRHKYCILVIQWWRIIQKFPNYFPVLSPTPIFLQPIS